MSDPRRHPYVYTVLRLVPRPDRGECLNIGVVLFSRPVRYLGIRVLLDEARVRALWPGLPLEALGAHLRGLELVAAGDPLGGPLAALDQSERFHWLSAVSDTMVQPGAVHTGLTDDPAATLDRLFAAQVLPG